MRIFLGALASHKTAWRRSFSPELRPVAREGRICYNPAMAKAKTHAKSRTQGWRFALWLVLAAFTLQAYITQTHMDNAAPAGIAKTVANSTDSKAPLNKSQPECPFCQAMAQAGVFHFSAAPLLLLTSAFIVMAAPNHPAPQSYDSTAHIWRSRAPPQH